MALNSSGAQLATQPGVVAAGRRAEAGSGQLQLFRCGRQFPVSAAVTQWGQQQQKPPPPLPLQLCCAHTAPQRLPPRHGAASSCATSTSRSPAASIASGAATVTRNCMRF